MNDDDDGYRPRTHDHLIEPMFGGLGVEHEGQDDGADEAKGEPEPDPPARRSFLRRLAGWLRGD